MVGGPFWENITFSIRWTTPRPFFQPNYRNNSSFSKVYLRPCVPPPPLFLKILRDSQLCSQVPQPENLGAKSLCLRLMPVLISTPVHEQAPSVKQNSRGPLPNQLGCMYFYKDCYHFAFHFAFSFILVFPQMTEN